LTLDIIGLAALNVELNCQTSASFVARTFQELNYVQELLGDPTSIHQLNILLHWRRYRAWREMNSWLKDQIRAHLASAEQRIKAHDIIDLAIHEFGSTVSVGDYAESAGAFIFAGYDTTSTTLSWLFYTLSQYPNVLRRMRDEHTRVFGPDGHDSEKICAQILEKPAKLSELKYTLQCIREILRLYPPASTARMSLDPKYAAL